jgi:hypothetical protein
LWGHKIGETGHPATNAQPGFDIQFWKILTCSVSDVTVRRLHLDHGAPVVRQQAVDVTGTETVSIAEMARQVNKAAISFIFLIRSGDYSSVFL